MSTSAPRLEISIRQHLQPHLRADSFAGSGRNFRRVSGDILQIVNIQGSRYGGQFAVNFGLQPLGILDIVGQPPDPRKITEGACEFRRRLSESGVDQWWSHDASQESMDAAVLAAADVYIRIGRSLLAQMGGMDSPLHTITADEMPGFPELFRGFGFAGCRAALVLARLRKSQGRVAEAVAFADYALAHIGAARGLRSELEALSRLGRGD